MKKNTIYFLLCTTLLFGCGDDEKAIPISDDEMEEEMETEEEEPVDCLIINHGNTGGPYVHEEDDITELEDVYEKFETYVREKDIEGLNGIFLHNSIPLFITGKRSSGITDIRLSAERFRSSVRNTPGLELRISDTDYGVSNGVAVSWANFEEIISGETNSTGVDLFFYVKNEEGWKLATTNNTFINPGDETDYVTEFPMNETPEDLLSNMSQAFNNKDENAWLNSFKSNSTFLVLSYNLKEPFMDTIHTTNSFIDCVIADDNQYTLSITDETVEIMDQYLAYVQASYSIDLNENEVESGNLVLTMIGTPQQGWKISAGAVLY